jgi:hypothetical protein
MRCASGEGCGHKLNGGPLKARWVIVSGYVADVVGDPRELRARIRESPQEGAAAEPRETRIATRSEHG